jgi:hypothetical protein
MAKYSYFLLKLLLQYPSSSPYLQSLSDKKQSWFYFFSIYDALQEQYVHLIVPQLKKLDVVAEHLPFCWFECLVKNGIGSSLSQVRKLFFEYVFAINDTTLSKIRNSTSFMQFFLYNIDKPCLYQVPGLGHFQSDFGEELGGFIYRSCMLGMKSEWISLLIQHIGSFTNKLPIIFILEGLEKSLGQIPNVPLLVDQDLENLYLACGSSRSQSILRNPSTKLVVAKLLEKILIKACKPESVSLSVLLKYL